MRVRCTKIINPATGEPNDTSSWLRIGHEYIVLEILAVPDRRVTLRVLGEDNSVALWDAEMFEVVDGTIPPNWVASVGPSGDLSLAPRRWLAGGFWEAFFDHDPDAISSFDHELAVISGMSTGSAPRAEA